MKSAIGRFGPRRAVAGRRGTRSYGCVAGVVTALVAGLAAPPADAGPDLLRTCNGRDWSLPKGLLRTPGTGLFTMGIESRQPEVEHRGFTLTWAELQPGPGRYDWKPLEMILARAEREDFGVVLRLKASVTRRDSPWGGLQAVPQWLLDREQPPRVRTRDRGPRDFIEVALPWHPGLEAAYLEFVEAFGRRGFASHPRLLGLYVHGISTSFGEEMWLDGPAYRRLRQHGLTPERLRSFVEARLRAWEAAFGPRTDRLAWVGAGWIDAGDRSGEFRRVRRELDALALELGLGRRWGNIEKYNGQLDRNGQRLHVEGRLETLADHPLVAEPRFWGAEDENWDGDDGEVFAYRRSVQRALQMRMRLLWVSDAGVAMDPGISRYFAQVAGKAPEAAPDAWSVLRESVVRVGGKRRVVGNLERWLHQREDVEAAKTRPVRRVERPPQPNDWDRAQEWTARRTDRAAGHDRIRFGVDTRFAQGAPEAGRLVQVRWIDDGARWRLVVPRDGARRASPTVSGTADGVEKTTTFSWDTKLSEGFELVVDQGDLTVSVVRVLRRTPDLVAAVCERETASEASLEPALWGGHG